MVNDPKKVVVAGFAFEFILKRIVNMVLNKPDTVFSGFITRVTVLFVIKSHVVWVWHGFSD